MPWPRRSGSSGSVSRSSWTKQDVIIVGHTRYKAAVKLGLAEVPVHVARGLTPAQARAYRIADNQTATLSPVGRRPLAAGADRPAGCRTTTCRSRASPPTNCRRCWHRKATAASGDPDEVPEPPAEPITKPGDLWLLGRHRLLCGDATKAEDVERLLDGSPADLLLTDPPYGVAYIGKTADALTIANDALARPRSTARFLAAAIGTAAQRTCGPAAASTSGTPIPPGCPPRWACSDAGLTVRQCLVWTKNTMVLGRQDYQWKHEPCLYGWADGAAHTWLCDRSQTTVLEFDKPARASDHPTMKPVELFAYLLAQQLPQGRPGARPVRRQRHHADRRRAGRPHGGACWNSIRGTAT